MKKVKRLDMMIDMLSMLKDDGVNANMVFVGKDVDGVNLEQMAKEKHLADQVWCYGPCFEEEKLGEIFYNATICVSPGNVGLTAIHALTYGCPVITHDDFPNQMPEFEAITDQETGGFFCTDNMKDMVDTTFFWIRKMNEERDVVREKAFATIDDKWNVNKQIEVLKSVLN